MRPVSAVWKHFETDKIGGKKTARCRYCSKRYSFPNATKMARHLSKCLKRPLSNTFVPSIPLETDSAPYVISDDVTVIPPAPEEEDTDKSSSTNNTFLLDVECESPLTSMASAVYYVPQVIKKKNQTVMKSFVDSITDAESDKLDAAFARAIYTSNCPLSLSDNPYWKDFLHLIRPSYRIPTRNDLTNNLLENEYMRVMELQKNKIKKSEFISILTDGWSNVRNEGIICYIITTPCPVFYKSIETTLNRHTGEYIAQELSSVINEVNSDKVVAVVTDNASNMKSAWKIIKNQFPHINTIGCAAHGINLLLNDISKIATVNLVITRSKDVIKYVKQRQALLSVFTAKQKLRKGTAASTLKLPADTRWSGVLIMFNSLLSGKESLQEAILQEDLDIDRDIRQLLLDNDLFWASINSLSKLLQPICDGIRMIESNKAVLSDVRFIFYNIVASFDVLVSTPLQTDEERQFINSVATRQAMCCQPIHLATYLLDPRYDDGEKLNSEEYKAAVDFLSNFQSEIPAAKIIGNLAQFKAHDDIFSCEALWSSAKHVSPLTWWKGLLSNQSLIAVAVKLFNIPPSSASCERIFSAFSKTHTVLRNRLNNDRVSKLIAIRSSLTMQDNIPDLEQASDFEMD